jgi:hypothetical protein
MFFDFSDERAIGRTVMWWLAGGAILMALLCWRSLFWSKPFNHHHLVDKRWDAWGWTAIALMACLAAFLVQLWLS